MRPKTSTLGLSPYLLLGDVDCDLLLKLLKNASVYTSTFYPA